MSLSSLSGVQAVLFDLDNTLYDRDVAFRRWAEGFVSERLGMGSETPSFIETMEWLIHQDAGGYGNKPSLFTELQRRHPEALSETLEELVESFHAGLVTQARLDGETTVLLEHLKKAGIPFGIVTNGSARQQRKIDHFGLDRLTRCVFISEIFGLKKPDPTIFLAAATHLGVAPEFCLFVGDHAEKDIIGAKRVGMRTAWLARGTDWPAIYADTPPDLFLTSLADLRTLLFAPESISPTAQ